MIKDKKTLKEFLSYEGYIYSKKRPYRFLPRFKEKSIIFKFLCLYRYEEYYFNTKKKIRHFLYYFMRRTFGRKIGINFDGINMIDKGIYIPHIGQILIRAKHIGKNCSISPNVFIVTGNDGSLSTIESDVSFGVGATVVGGVRIAKGVAVGANALVCKDCLEENVTIGGNPARIISNNGSKTWGGRKYFPHE